jgi:hypothetical protein
LQSTSAAILILGAGRMTAVCAKHAACSAQIATSADKLSVLN